MTDFYRNSTGARIDFSGVVQDRMGARHSGPNVLAAWPVDAIAAAFDASPAGFPETPPGHEIVAGSDRVSVSYNSGLIFERDFRPVPAALSGDALAEAIRMATIVAGGGPVTAEYEAMVSATPTEQLMRIVAAAGILAELTGPQIGAIAAGI